MSDYIDWYDKDKIEKLRKARTKKYMNLVRKWHTAKEKDDKDAMAKVFKAMSKHNEADKTLQEKAENAGSYWY